MKERQRQSSEVADFARWISVGDGSFNFGEICFIQLKIAGKLAHVGFSLAQAVRRWRIAPGNPLLDAQDLGKMRLGVCTERHARNMTAMTIE